MRPVFEVLMKDSESEISQSCYKYAKNFVETVGLSPIKESIVLSIDEWLKEYETWRIHSELIENCIGFVEILSEEEFNEIIKKPLICLLIKDRIF